MKLTTIFTTGPLRRSLGASLLTVIATALLLAAPAAVRAQSFYVSKSENILLSGLGPQIEKVDPSGTVSLFAALPAGSSPFGVAVDGSGYLYVADGNGTQQILKITPDGTVSVFATLPAGSVLTGLAFDGSGNLYAGSGSNEQIFKITPDGTVNVFASLSLDSFPMGLAFDGSGNLYAADYRQDYSPGRIIKITSDGTVSIFAILPAGSFAMGLAFDGSGNLYAADSQTSQISKIAPDGTVSVFVDFPVNSFPRGLVFDDSGNLCVTLGSDQVCKITPDGAVSTFATGILGDQFIVAAPVVALSPMATEGGFSTSGSVWLNIPAAAPEASVALSSSNTSLVAVPASLTLPQGITTMSFAVNTAPVNVVTVVPITAIYNGTTVSANVTLSPAPVIAISALSGPEVAGGSPMPVTVSLNNFSRAAAGAVINLTSSDTGTLKIPATVTVPYGAFSATVNATTTTVSALKTVILTAAYNGSTFTTTVTVRPIPKVTITQADYLTDTHEFKVAATTSTPAATAIMTFGGSPNAAPFGAMQFETDAFRASIILSTAPTQATVWDSLGGMATVSVRLKTSTTATGGGGGGTATTFKLSVSINGKGSVTTSPAATSYAAGTVVTLTATPAAGQPWVGWSGAITGTVNPTTVTISKDTSVTANFR